MNDLPLLTRGPLTRIVILLPKTTPKAQNTNYY
jgi:hypothetical protein